MAEQFLHLVRGSPLDFRHDVRVPLLREGELGVTKRLLDDLGVDITSEHQAGRSVSQVVKALSA